MSTTDTMIAETPTPTPTAAAVEPINQASVARGNLNARNVLGAEGVAGAMIFSQNCYGTLMTPLSWTKLDQCGAFDMAVVAATDGLEEAEASELDYFEAEAAAGRYLQAVTSGGERVDKADLRLSALQARVARLRPAVRAEPTFERSETGELVLNELEGGGDTPDE